MGSQRPAAEADPLDCASFSSLKAAAPSNLHTGLAVRRILTQTLKPRSFLVARFGPAEAVPWLQSASGRRQQQDYWLRRWFRPF
jgi:hypothetical protein